MKKSQKIIAGIILSLTIVISGFLVIDNLRSNQTHCTMSEHDDFESYQLFFKYNNKRALRGCTTNGQAKKQLDSKFLYRTSDLENTIALHGEDDLVLIDKKTGEIQEKTGVITLGSVQKVVNIDDKIALVTNEGAGIKGPDNYGSQILSENMTITSQGGLILTAIQRGNFVYTTERNFSTNARHLYKYTTTGDFVKEIEHDLSLPLTENNLLMDQQQNIVSAYGRIITVIHPDDTVTEFSVLEDEALFGAITLFYLAEQIYAVDTAGHIFTVDIELQTAQLLEVIAFGHDQVKDEDESVSDCYSNTTQAAAYIICDVVSENEIGYTTLNPIVFNVTTKEIIVGSLFTIDEATRNYPAFTIVFPKQ